MKSLSLLILLLLTVNISFAQNTEAEKTLLVHKKDTVDGWKKGGTFAVNLSQTAFSNWASGGVNSMAINSFLQLYAHKTKGKHLWENYFELGYGTLNQSSNKLWQKTDDKINFTSKYGTKAFAKWYYAALLNFRSQMMPGFKNVGDDDFMSTFLAPAYTLGTVGMEYVPNKKWRVYIAPITLKHTWVNNQRLANEGAFGVEGAVSNSLGEILIRGHKSRLEFGGYSRIFYKGTIMEDVKLEFNINLFSNYMESPLNIDINAGTTVSMKVNKYISAYLILNTIYDHDIKIPYDTDGDGVQDGKGPRLQIKEVFGAGFSYSFK